MVTHSRSPAMWANPHDIIGFPFHIKEDIFAISAPLYKQGLSLREIAMRTGFPKTVVRTELVRKGISLRPTRMTLKVQGWRRRGTTGVKPPYGFCFLEGQLARHPKEYPVLHIIHDRWKREVSLNSIATYLNSKKIPSPMGKKWSWNSVVNVIDRFKSGKIINRGGKYELR